MNNQGLISVELSFSRREDGMLEAAYFRFRPGKVAQTRELVGTSVLGDYDKAGHLLGLEVLAPVRLRDLLKHVERSDRIAFRQIVSQRMADLVA